MQDLYQEHEFGTPEFNDVNSAVGNIFTTLQVRFTT
jgi:hypothetical protein